MKKHTLAIFAARKDAEKAINYIHNELDVPDEEISYIYKNSDGEIKEVEAAEISSPTPAEGAGTGAKAGAVIGGVAGMAIAAGLLPAIGPAIAAGPLLAALGITGAVGTTAAGAISGAAVGGLIGALANMGIGKEKAQLYEDQVMAGNILVAVHTDKDKDVATSMRKFNALDVDSFMVRL